MQSDEILMKSLSAVVVVVAIDISACHRAICTHLYRSCVNVFWLADSAAPFWNWRTIKYSLKTQIKRNAIQFRMHSMVTRNFTRRQRYHAGSNCIRSTRYWIIQKCVSQMRLKLNIRSNFGCDAIGKRNGGKIHQTCHLHFSIVSKMISSHFDSRSNERRIVMQTTYFFYFLCVSRFTNYYFAHRRFFWRFNALFLSNENATKE